MKKTAQRSGASPTALPARSGLFGMMRKRNAFQSRRGFLAGVGVLRFLRLNGVKGRE